MQPEDYNARQYLECGIVTTIDTVSVGILNILEINFGHLWGHEKDVSDLTKEQLVYLIRWKEVRSQILGRAEKSKNILLDNASKRLNIFNKERERFDD